MFFINIIGFLMTNFSTTPKKDHNFSSLLNILRQSINSRDFSQIFDLIKEGVDLNKKYDSHLNYTLLHFAVEEGDVDLIKILIENGADINAKTVYDQTPLTCAISVTNIQLAKMLIEKGADVNTKTVSGITPLNCAIHITNIQLAKMLIEKGADVNTKTVSGKTPLHYAAQSLHSSIERCMEPNQKYKNNRTILENREFTMIKFLIRMGADIYAESAQGTPIQYVFDLAQKTGNYVIYETFLNATKLEMGSPEKYMYLPKVEASRFRNDSLLSDTQSLSRSLQKTQSKEPGLICSSCPKEVNSEKKYLLDDNSNHFTCKKEQKPF